MTLDEIKAQRESLGIQMGVGEIALIASNIHPPIKLLVFGLGNDSIFWHTLNAGGTTMFIEDKPRWFRTTTEKYPGLTAFKVEYGTTRAQWRDMLDHPDILYIELPAPVMETVWDAIIVDGPAAHDDEAIGRMKSLYMASKLIKDSGDIFVHDAEREVEGAYCNKYLGAQNLVGTVTDYSTLNHYRITERI
jgi:hypothetical protein